jgi:hypothetical protein
MAEENLVMEWQHAFLESQADASRGDYAMAIARLERILVQMNGMAGPAADRWLPKTWGLLGTLYYHAGDRDKARAVTAEARAHCERLGDRRGVETYTRNLSVMDLS